MQRQGGILLHRKNEERMSGLKETIVALKIREREREHYLKWIRKFSEGFSVALWTTDADITKE